MKRLLFAIVILIGLFFSSAFIVSTGNFALLSNVGDNSKQLPRLVNPGLHFRLPFVQKIVYGDQRRQLLIADGSTDKPYLSVQTFDKHSMQLGYALVWQITKPLDFYQANQRTSVLEALRNQLNSALAENLSLLTLPQLLTLDQQQNAINNTLIKVNKSLQTQGIQLDSVMLTSMTVANAERGFWLDRMKSAQEVQLNQLRQETSTLSQSLRANAEAKAANVLVTGETQADQIRAQADLDATQIYSDAYNKNPSFYEFFHNLQMYKKVLNSKQDVLVLSTHTPFFQSLTPVETKEKN